MVVREEQKWVVIKLASRRRDHLPAVLGSGINEVGAWIVSLSLNNFGL